MTSVKINLKRFVGLLILPFSFVIPKSKQKWAFGSNMGYTGNAKHLFIYVNENYNGKIKPCWITDKKQELENLKSLGKPVAYKWSLKGMLFALTAKVYFYNSYVSDINEYTFGNVIRFNLWHGVALKHIERTKKIPDKKYISKNPFIKFRFFRFLIRPSYVLTSSPTQSELFARSFAVNEKQCVEGTYPRNEILQFEKEKLREYISRNEYDDKILKLFDSMEKFQHRIIYMPTWRDSGRNFLKQIGLDLEKLDKTLQDINGCLILKLHPATNLDIDMSKLSNVIMLDNNIDIYPLLPLTDCLLTDYSSIYFDYVLMNHKRIIFYIPDLEEYTSGDRDFAFPFASSIEGERIFDFESLISALKNWDNCNEKTTNGYSNKAFWDPAIKGNDNLIKFISEKINLNIP